MLITGLVFILILGLLVFVHEFGHFWVARKVGVTVHEFAFGFRPRLFSWKRGETTYAINLIPLGGYVRLEGEDADTGKKGSLMGKPPVKRILIFIAGVVMNLVLGWLLLVLAYGIGCYSLSPTFESHAGVVTDRSIYVGTVNPNSPASVAGLHKGDKIVAVAQQPVADALPMIQIFKQKAGQSVDVTYERQGVKAETQLVPRQNPPQGEGAIGITVEQSSITRTAWYRAPWVALQETGAEIKSSFVGFIGFISKLIVRQQVDENVAGIVGVGSAVGVVRRLGISTLMQFTALISINLAVLNILPVPPLDGGHVLFTALEAIRKKPVKEAYRGWITIGGLIAILLLFVIVTYQDLARLAIFESLKHLF